MVDALAEKYYTTSGYAYTLNDPINHIDIMGLKSMQIPQMVGGDYAGSALNWGFLHSYDFFGNTSDAGMVGGGSYICMSGWGSSDSQTQLYDEMVKAAWNNEDITPYILEGAAGGNWKYVNYVTGKKRKGHSYAVVATIEIGIPKGKMDSNKKLAWYLRLTPITLMGDINPFFGAVAVMGDAGLTISGVELDADFVFVLAGDDMGVFKTYDQEVAGFGSDMGVGVELVRVDLLAGDINKLKVEDFGGMRSKIYGGGELFGFISSGLSFSYSNPRSNFHMLGTGVQAGFGVSMFGTFYLGFNWGDINIHN